ECVVHMAQPLLLGYQLGMRTRSACCTLMYKKSLKLNQLMTAKLTDNRLRHMVEIISGMRVIKMYAWEQPFADIGAEARNQEVSCIKRSCILKAINMSLNNMATKLILFTSFITLVLTGDVLTAKTVFVSTMLFNYLRTTMTWYLPQAIMFGADCNQWLRMTKQLPKNCKQSPGVFNNNITAKWSDESSYPTLQNISTHLRPGDLLAVIGPVGAGKL
ncbi:unnamed protein product, partial [Medioppia subpectinata]